MSRLTSFRDHAARMAVADHKPDCPHITARKPFFERWRLAPDGMSMSWNGPEPPWSPPPCDGCVTDADRTLWDRLAREVDDYLTRDEGMFA